MENLIKLNGGGNTKPHIYLVTTSLKESYNFVIEENGILCATFSYQSDYAITLKINGTTMNTTTKNVSGGIYFFNYIYNVKKGDTISIAYTVDETFNWVNTGLIFVAPSLAQTEWQFKKISSGTATLSYTVPVSNLYAIAFSLAIGTGTYSTSVNGTSAKSTEDLISNGARKVVLFDYSKTSGTITGSASVTDMHSVATVVYII